VRPYQAPPEGAPVGLSTIRQLTGQPAAGVANFSRDYFPGTSIENLTLQSVNVINAGVGVLTPLASNASKITATTPIMESATKEPTVIVHRFCDVTDMQTLLPRAATISEEVANEVMSRFDDPIWLMVRAEGHAWGIVEKSPFVSVGTDLGKLASSPDPILSTIATGLPGAPGYARAPFIATFEIPASRLFTPFNDLSVKETELLFLGGDLHRFLISARPNPY
jgi:hypothetical protein